MCDIREDLGIKLASPYFEEAYQKALSEPALPVWLTEEYIHRLNDTYRVLPKTYEKVLAALCEVVKIPSLCLLAKTVYHILDTKLPYGEAFTDLDLPKPPEGARSIGYDCVMLFPVLGHIVASHDALAARGVDEDVITASLLWTDNFFAEACEKLGKLAYPKEYFAAYGAGIYVKTLIIGRLRFEIAKEAIHPVRMYQSRKGELLPLMDHVTLHQSGQMLGSFGCEEESGSFLAEVTETEDAYEGYTVDPVTRLVLKERIRLPKSEWTEIYRRGMNAIKVHIPAGGRLDPAACEASYTRAKELLPRAYPEYRFSCFLICCWMLSPLLKEILPPTSNIVVFGEKYTVFPMKSDAKDAFGYVFGIHGKELSKIDFASLPEENSLQRGIKREALLGRFVHQYGGYIPW